MDSSRQTHRAYGSYTNDELRAIRFRSVKEFDRAIDLTESDSELKGLPWDTPDGITMFVPAEAVAILKTKGLKFKVSTLLNLGDLPADRLSEMRRKHAV